MGAEVINPIISREGEDADEHSIMTAPLRALRKPADASMAPSTDVETGPPDPTEYFAYGPNMATAKLQKRTPSARPFGLATLAGQAGVRFLQPLALRPGLGSPSSSCKVDRTAARGIANRSRGPLTGFAGVVAGRYTSKAFPAGVKGSVLERGGPSRSSWA